MDDNLILTIDKLEESKKYWLGKFLGRNEELKFQIDFYKDSHYEKGEFIVLFPEQLTEKLLAISKNQDLSLYVLLFTIYNILLSKLSMQREIIIGTPAFTSGEIINNDYIFLKNIIEDEINFKELLLNVKQTVSDGYRNQYYPIERIFDLLKIENHNSLYRTFFLMENIHKKKFIINLLEKYENYFNATIKRNDKNINLTICYNKNLFKLETIERIINCYFVITRQVINNTNIKIKEIELLDEKEKKQNEDYNQTDFVFNRYNSVYEIYEEQVSKYPDNIALIFNDLNNQVYQKLTFSELNKISNKIARILRKNGLKNNLVTAIYMENSIELIITILAVLKSGGAYLPLSTNLPKDRINFMLNDSDVKLILTKRNIDLTDIIFNKDKIIYIDKDDNINEDDSNLININKTEDIAYIIYTSGSTGYPKGVIIEHGSLINFIIWKISAYKFNYKDITIQLLSPIFDAFGTNLYSSIFSGGRLVLADQNYWGNFQYINNLMKKEKITNMNITPSMMSTIIAYLDNEALEYFRLIVLGGEEIPKNLISLIHKKNPNIKIINEYGPTEATITTCYYECNNESDASILGKPINNCKVFILNHHNNEMPFQFAGEICIAGLGLSKGYINQPELTDKKFTYLEKNGKKIYRSGDMGKRLLDGNIEFLRRLDNQAKIRGFRIELNEIKRAINLHPAINDCIVLINEKDFDEKKIISYIKPDYKYRLESNEFIETEMGKEMVSDWKMIFNGNFNKDNYTDATFNISGWNSSFTGEPIPQNEMKEWLDSTIKNISGYKPVDILEIGCGSGMLLFKLAGKSYSYTATDFSKEAIEYVKKTLSQLKIDSGNIKLFYQEADDFSNMNEKKFDMVILNSVVQYFPDSKYLINVIKEAIRCIKNDGVLFIGDVRNYALHNTFHFSLAVHYAESNMTIEKLKKEIKKNISLDSELIIHPYFFYILKKNIPEITNVEIKYKRGKIHNELNMFRYDVFLTINSKEDILEPQLIDWNSLLSTEKLIEYINYHKPEALEVKNIPNKRINDHIHAFNFFNDNKFKSTDEIKINKDNNAIDPEDIFYLENIIEYKVDNIWSGNNEHMNFNALFIKKNNLKKYTSHVLKDENIHSASITKFTNNPIMSKISKKIIPEIKKYLEKLLPEYMIPSCFIMLDNIPLTINGKIDIESLPEPDFKNFSSNEYEAPTTEIEKKLVSIWEEILDINDIGIKDDFFNLGGNSFTAVTLLSRIQKAFNFEITINHFFKNPTIKGLYELIGEGEFKKYINIQPVEKRDYYPATTSQKRLFILHQLSKEQINYNMPSIINISGDLDTEKFISAFEKLVDRHDILRTYFLIINNNPVQIIADRIEINTKLIKIDADKIDSEIQKFIKPFNLEELPLFRFSLLEFSKNEYLFLFDIHHIILDGVSMGLLFQELLDLYQDKKIDAPVIRYKDYSVWQSKFNISKEYKKQEKYWLETLSGELPVLNFPYDYTRPALQSFTGNIFEFIIDRNLYIVLKKIISETDTTLYMILLAAFNILLWKYSNQEDIIIGTAVGGRNLADIEKTLGLFINTILMRNYPSGKISIEQFIKQVKKNSLLSYENQNYPFEDLIEKLNIKKDLSRNAIFDVMFLMQNMQLPNINLKNIYFKPYQFEVNVSKFDLTLNVIENDREENILCVFEYCDKLFKKETIIRMSNHFKSIINDIVGNKTRLMRDINFIDEEEKKIILEDFNDTQTYIEEDKTIHQAFEEYVNCHSKETAISFLDGNYSYEEINIKANQLSNFLISKGLKPKDIAVIILNRTEEMLISILATLKAGGIYLPIDPEYPGARIDYIIKDSGAKIIISNEEIFTGKNNNILFELNNRDFIIINPLDQKILSQDKNNLQVACSSNDTAYLIYTSGSTGKPKGVSIRHQSVINFIKGIDDKINISECNVMLCLTTISFDIFVLESLLPLIKGIKIVVAREQEQKDTNLLSQLITDQNIDIIQITPSRLRIMLNNEKSKLCLKNLKKILIGGEKFPDTLLKQLQKITNAEIYNMYGPTETTVWSLVKNVTEDDIVTIGKPIANTSVYILNENLNLQPIGIVGDLYIGGKGLAKGYWKNNELTNQNFISNPYKDEDIIYKTGDLAKWLPDGNILFYGRYDSQVKIRGYRVEIGEIEYYLSQHENIDCVTVIDKIDNDGNEFLTAYYSLKNKEIKINPGYLKKILSINLPEYMIPSFFIEIDTIPLTPNGKMDRLALKKRKDNIIKSEGDGPGNEIEIKLVDIWKEVLNVESLNINDNFFDLGGHSLKAMNLVNKINQEFTINISLENIFQYNTIKTLSCIIPILKNNSNHIIPVLPKREYYELSSAQKRLYALSCFNNIDITYNMPGVFLIKGKPDIKKIETSFQKLINRHEVFRSFYKIIDEKPVQIILDKIEFSLYYHEEKNEETESIIKKFIRPFDLSAAPLFRAGLIKITDKEDTYLMLIDIHHIIADGISLNILVKNFVDFYNNNKMNELKIQYKDFTDWYNQYQNSFEYKNQEQYWLKQFEQKIESIALPLDYPRPATSTFEGDYIKFSITTETVKRIKKIISENNITLYMLFFAVFHVLLYKLTGQSDIVIGTPIAGRNHPDLNEVIGMFVNSLPIRNKLSEDMTFKEFMLVIKRNCLKAYENQDCQFENIIEKLKVKRDLNRNPLFDVSIQMQNMESVNYSLPDLIIMPYEFKYAVSKFDLTLTIEEIKEADNSVQLRLEYKIALFDRETIEIIRDQMVLLIDSVIENLFIPINEIKIETDLQRKMKKMDSFQLNF